MKRSEKIDIVSRINATLTLELVPFECYSPLVLNNQTKGETMKRLGLVQSATLLAMRLTGCRWRLRAEWVAGPQGNRCKTIRILDALHNRGLVFHPEITRYELTDEGVAIADASRAVPAIVEEALRYLAGDNRKTPQARKRPQHIVTKGPRR